MDILQVAVDRFRTQEFKDYSKSAFKKQVNMPSVNVVWRNFSYGDLRSGQYSNTKIFQPPPFVVGGYVGSIIGSKICDSKNASFNCCNLLGALILRLQTDQPNKSNFFPPIGTREEVNWRVKTTAQNDSHVTSSKSGDTSTPSKVVIPPKIVMQQSVSPVSSAAVMPKQQDSNLSPAACRTLSESSESSWASVSQLEDRFNVLSSNPWLSNIVVCVSDSDDADESDSDWDCVEDFQSENGEVINDLTWNGDSLSPISSPVSRTPPTQVAALDDYDSDESDGILISCGHGYVVDDEEEAQERRVAEERIQDANRRWDQNLLTADETDSTKKSKHTTKQVRFPADNKLVRVRPMITWVHAYRAARKGDWERLARDADRFRERIDSIATVLAPVLDPSHRERIRRRNLENEITNYNGSNSFMCTGYKRDTNVKSVEPVEDLVSEPATTVILTCPCRL